MSGGGRAACGAGGGGMFRALCRRAVASAGIGPNLEATKAMRTTHKSLITALTMIFIVSSAALWFADPRRVNSLLLRTAFMGGGGCSLRGK